MVERIIYSFIVDEHPKFAYQAWHLAHSLRVRCAARPADITIQTTPAVADEIRNIFYAEGYALRDLQTFGDGKWCNKIAQIPNLIEEDCDRIVLLDTDMIAVDDIRPFLHGAAVQAKVVDIGNPPLTILREIIAPLSDDPFPLMTTDAARDETIVGNANGGFYAVPKAWAGAFHAAWRDWALWLLAHDEPLARVGKTSHIDQVSAALAFRLSHIPFAHLPSNANYFLHFRGEHRYFDPDRPISLIHYHDMAMDAAGRLASPTWLTALETDAVTVANRQIGTFCQDRLLEAYQRAFQA